MMASAIDASQHPLIADHEHAASPDAGNTRFMRESRSFACDFVPACCAAAKEPPRTAKR
jgi:hypothetical protein